MTDKDRNDPLIAAAGALATAVAPERDLWPGIAEGINRPRRHWSHYLAQAAAVVLLVGASSAITWWVMSNGSMQAPPLREGFSVQTVSANYRFMPGSGYFEARVDVAGQLDEELARLAPETRLDVEKNLQIVRDAIAEINAALADEPTNSLLQELLLRAYREEMSLMHRVGGLTQQLMSREDI